MNAKVHDELTRIREELENTGRGVPLSFARGRKRRRRRYFNIRYARFLATKYLLSKIGVLKRRYSIYPEGIWLEDAASDVLSDRVHSETFALNDRERRHLDLYPGTDYTLDDEGRLELSSRVLLFKVADCALLSRNFSVLHRPSQKIVLRSHNLTHPNRVVPCRYKSTISVPGVAVRLNTDNYFHFIFNALRGLCGHLPYVKELQSATVLMRPGRPPYQAAACASLQAKYPALKFLEVPEDHKVLCENLAIGIRERASFIDTFSNRETIEGIRDLYLNQYGIITSAPRRRLLISRNRQKKRNLRNEDRLFDLLRPLGFELVAPEMLDHAEQVRLFSEAEAVVAVSGAALTNLVFCQPGTKVLEIMPDRIIHFPFWIGMCKLMALQHRCVIASSTGRRRHLTANVEELRDQVRDMVE